MAQHKWLQSALHTGKIHRGALHRALHVPEGEPIPASKMEEARNSDNPHMKRMVNLAKTMSKFHHGK